jgi:hypothetical protein
LSLYVKTSKFYTLFLPDFLFVSVWAESFFQIIYLSRYDWQSTNRIDEKLKVL